MLCLDSCYKRLELFNTALQRQSRQDKPDKVQLFPESVERHFGIESEHFDSNHFNEVHKFIQSEVEIITLMEVKTQKQVLKLFSACVVIISIQRNEQNTGFKH